VNIEELGKEGEQEARKILKHLGFELTAPDWLGRRGGKWTAFEIKRKERFKSPPFDGHGLNLWQVERRMDLFRRNNLRTFLMIWEIPSNIWFGQWLDVLEDRGNRNSKTEKHITKNQVVIYPLRNFKLLKKGLKENNSRQI